MLCFCWNLLTGPTFRCSVNHFPLRKISRNEPLLRNTIVGTKCGRENENPVRRQMSQGLARVFSLWLYELYESVYSCSSARSRIVTTALHVMGGFTGFFGGVKRNEASPVCCGNSQDFEGDENSRARLTASSMPSPMNHQLCYGKKKKNNNNCVWRGSSRRNCMRGPGTQPWHETELCLNYISIATLTLFWIRYSGSIWSLYSP